MNEQRDLPHHHGASGSTWRGCHRWPMTWNRPWLTCKACGEEIDDLSAQTDATAKWTNAVYCEDCFAELPACPICETACNPLFLGEHLTDDHNLTGKEVDKILLQQQ